MIEEKFSLNEFIDEKVFLNLAGCILIVSGTVELLKVYIDINPLWLNLAISSLVTFTRIAILGDFSLKGVAIGIFNLIPILLGATGIFEFLKNIMGGTN